MGKEKVREYNIETMTGVGKKLKLAGREYEVLPVNIEDMHYIIGEINENEEDYRIFLVDKEQLEKDANNWALFGFNVMGKRKETFMRIINKYVFYKEHNMTEELLIEHNWSFKEIGEFLFYWTQQVSD